MKSRFLNLCLVLFSPCCFATHVKDKPHLPPVGLGTVALGRNWGVGGAKSETPSEETAKAVLEAAYKNGWHLIDTASSYQASEERIGRYLPQSLHQYILVTKPGEHSIRNDDPRCIVRGTRTQYCLEPAADYDFSRAAIKRDIDQSLKELNVKTIDIALLHLQNETALDTLKKGDALQTLLELKRQRLIKYIGVSVNGPAALHAVKYGNIDVIELEYNLLNQSNKPAIDLAYKKGIAVIVRGGLGTGLLTEYVKDHLSDPNMPYGPQVRALVELTNGHYDLLTRLALAFLQDEKHIDTILLGADRPELIEKDVRLMQATYDPHLLSKAKKLMQQFKTPALYTESAGVYYFRR